METSSFGRENESPLSANCMEILSAGRGNESSSSANCIDMSLCGRENESSLRANYMELFPISIGRDKGGEKGKERALLFAQKKERGGERGEGSEEEQKEFERGEGSEGEKKESEREERREDKDTQRGERGEGRGERKVERRMTKEKEREERENGERDDVWEALVLVFENELEILRKEQTRKEMQRIIQKFIAGTFSLSSLLSPLSSLLPSFPYFTLICPCQTQ